MAWYFYFQTEPESEWHLADASTKVQVVEQENPCFITALELDTLIGEGTTQEEFEKIRYRGDFYVDFDSEEIEEACDNFKKFLKNLEDDYKIKLEQLELYASGGKGFHVVIPFPVYVSKVNSAGYSHLHLIYKEMAQTLYVDTLDMRVYSGKRGRMFRTVNVQRANGKYKVPLSVQEAKGITPELYDELTSNPRDGFQIQKPELSTQLALLFTTSRDKVEGLLKGRGRFKRDAKIVQKFEGKFPPSFLSLASGQGVKEGAGFHNIAMQIAITAHAIGKTLDETLAVSQGLIDTHTGNSRRYGTPEKRKAEIVRMYYYMQDNPCYNFSAGALRAVLSDDVDSPELDTSVNDEYGILDEDAADDLGINDQISRGVRIVPEGIFLKQWDKDEGEYKVIQLSELGIDNVAMLNELATHNTMGFEFDCFVGGKSRGRKTVTANTFTSASQVRANLGGPVSATVQVTDAQAVGMMDIMRKLAEKSGRVVTALPREGVDVVTLNDQDVRILYVGSEKDGVWNENQRLNNFRLMAENGTDGNIQSDIMSAGLLEEKDRFFFEHFFKLQPPEVLAPILGYNLASFMNMLIRKVKGQFPMMQVAGQAGAGKTSFNHLMTRLHYYKANPSVWGANSVTPFALTTMLQSTASIPILFDEFKRTELPMKRVQEYLLIMRNNYTGNTGGKGKVIKDAGAGRLTIQKSASVAPLIFLTENLESQTAILDRSVVVHMRDKIMGTSEDWHIVNKHYDTLGRWGRMCIQKVLATDLDSLSDEIFKFETKVADMGKPMTARPQFNLAIVLLGLSLGKAVLASVYGSAFDHQFETMEETLLGSIEDVAPQSESEFVKVMSTLAYLSSSQNSIFALERGTDYELVTSGVGMCVEIHLRNAWDKYSRFRRSQGEEILLGSESAFINAFMRHNTVTDKVCVRSTLKQGRLSTQVVQYNLDKLYEEGVEEFAE